VDVSELRDRMRMLQHVARDKGARAQQFAAGLLYDAMLFTPYKELTDEGIEVLKSGVALAESDVKFEDLGPLRSRLINAGLHLNPPQPKLPDISFFWDLKESYQHGWKNPHGCTNFAIIVTAVSDRPRGRYHVYRIDRLEGTIKRIGCELPLHVARAVARRPKYRDSEPLTGGELKVGRWTMTKWKNEEPLYPE
jgi:hypothetical protein